MKTVSRSLLVLSLACVPGCSQESPRGTDTFAKPEPSTTPKSGEPGWTYQSAEHGFTLNLPSAAWREMAKKRFLADFWCPTRVGSPMLAGVMSVQKQSREQFRASIPEFKANLEKHGDYLVKPTFQEGQTTTGHLTIFAAMCEKGDAATQFIYVANAAVWLPDKGITVTTLFEGQGQMRSLVFQAIDYADFEAAAKSICLSPR